MRDEDGSGVVPDPIMRSNPVRIPWTGTTDGALTTEVTYTDTAAAGTASTGNTISLGEGYVFRLRTCVEYHLDGTPPVSSCAERNVDTRSNSTAVDTFAPSVTLSGQPRPTTQPWAYFSAYTEVLYFAGVGCSSCSWRHVVLGVVHVAFVARPVIAMTR
jgi:hypothetical protein